ncbi:unnamed protein product, partial [Protopolystoma xenopodis]
EHSDSTRLGQFDASSDVKLNPSANQDIDSETDERNRLPDLALPIGEEDAEDEDEEDDDDEDEDNNATGAVIIKVDTSEQSGALGLPLGRYTVRTELREEYLPRRFRSVLALQRALASRAINGPVGAAAPFTCSTSNVSSSHLAGGANGYPDITNGNSSLRGNGLAGEAYEAHMGGLKRAVVEMEGDASQAEEGEDEQGESGSGAFGRTEGWSIGGDANEHGLQTGVLNVGEELCWFDLVFANWPEHQGDLLERI